MWITGLSGEKGVRSSGAVGLQENMGWGGSYHGLFSFFSFWQGLMLYPRLSLILLAFDINKSNIFWSILTEHFLFYYENWRCQLCFDTAMAAQRTGILWASKWAPELFALPSFCWGLTEQEGRAVVWSITIILTIWQFFFIPRGIQEEKFSVAAMSKYCIFKSWLIIATDHCLGDAAWQQSWLSERTRSGDTSLLDIYISFSSALFVCLNKKEMAGLIRSFWPGFSGFPIIRSLTSTSTRFLPVMHLQAWACRVVVQLASQLVMLLRREAWCTYLLQDSPFQEKAIHLAECPSSQLGSGGAAVRWKGHAPSSGLWGAEVDLVSSSLPLLHKNLLVLSRLFATCLVKKLLNGYEGYELWHRRKVRNFFLFLVWGSVGWEVACGSTGDEELRVSALINLGGSQGHWSEKLQL